ncbi:MAG: SMC family ATPase, partial [Chloroflexi bacterium]|nr:SMC family ATPase [Chloroflexota bacterium]
MIPLRLSVKNFMCYRDDVPPLHFEGIHVACLCGDNGHGKTALLDAITWALWGIARATPTGTGTINALRMSDLVHMGQTDMGVELDFTAGDQRYRVIRRHTVSTRGSNSRTTLELQIATGDDGDSFRSISRNTVRETNARISEILNMDFKTFVNTAYLAQGQADLFTTSTPTERKRCLAEVLDLSYYQRLSEDANAHSRRIQTEIQQALTAINLHSEDTARRPDYEKRLTEVNVYIEGATPQAEVKRKQVETLRQEVQRLQALESDFAALRRRAKSAEADAVRLQRQASADEKRVSAYEATIAEVPQTLAGYQALQSAHAELERLDTALSEKSRLDKRHAALSQSIARQEERLASTHKTLQQRISAELEPRANLLPEIKEQQAELQQRHAVISQQTASIERQRADTDSISTRIQVLEQDNERLLEQMQDTRRKFDMLEQGEATCPLCNQQLGADGQQHLRAEYRRIGVESRASYKENRAHIDTLTREHKTATHTLTSMEVKHQSEGRTLAAAEVNLARDEHESLRARDDLRQASQALAEAERALCDKAFA